MLSDLLTIASPNLRAGLQLANDHIRVTADPETGCISTLARSDGTDTLKVLDDVFEILMFDDSRFTVKDYSLAKADKVIDNDGAQRLQLEYRRLAATAPTAPSVVKVGYILGKGPYIRKTVQLRMHKGDKIDRLAVMQFSADTKASLGGRGQPVVFGNWWFGADYPCFYARHTDDYKDPNYKYRWDYMINLRGRDKIIKPRPHMMSLFHYPGHARKQADGSWKIIGKTAVFGVSAIKGEPAELGLFDYINETRKPTRSHIHFNNWYSRNRSTKKEQFVDKTYIPMAKELAKYGAKLDAMVFDHGWEKTDKRCFEPKSEDVIKTQKALKAAGTELGLWIALDGTNQRFNKGIKAGYRAAYGEGFDRSQYRWMSGNKVYWDILQDKYYNDVREALRYMIKDLKADYIKHDFNHAFSSNYLTQRHAREACLDRYLELLAYERKLHPGIFINYTNGAWFSPFWLQQVDCLWMMTGDSGGNKDWPQLSLREGASTYRCKYFELNFSGNHRPRPTIPISNFMTHGILLSDRKPFTEFNDTLHDWANYVVMYCGRGTSLIELYLDIDLLDAGQWKALATTLRWVDKKQVGMRNSVYVGGTPSKGELYGYISWVDGKAMLTLRNPDRAEQTIEIPFDHTVYFRGEKGKPYRVKTTYPFVEDMPWKLTSGKPISITVPGDSVMLFEIEPGAPKKATAITPKPLPEAKTMVEGKKYVAEFMIPDEDFKRYDFIPVIRGRRSMVCDTLITVNGKAMAPKRVVHGRSWTIAQFDLRKFRGKTVRIEGELVNIKDSKAKTAKLDGWLVVDRPVEAPEATEPNVPFSISQHHRRITENLFKKIDMPIARKVDDSPLARKMAE